MMNLTAVLQLRNEMSGQLRNAIRDLNSTSDASSRLNTGLNKVAKVGFKAIVAGGAAAGAGILAIGTNAVTAAADAEAMNAQFEQVFADLGPQAQKAIDAMGKEFDMTSNRLKPAMSSMTSMFSGLGIDTKKAMGMASEALAASADASAFYDVSMESAQGSLSSFLKGNYEAGESIGIFGSAAALSAHASKNLGQEFDKLDEAGKQMVRLDFAKNMQESAGATGQAARESDSLTNQLGNVKQLWTDLMAKLGEGVLPIVIGHIKDLAGYLKNFDTQPVIDGVQMAVDKFLAFKAAATPVLTTIIEKAREFAAFIKNNWGVISTTMLAIGGALAVVKIALTGMAIIGGITKLWNAYKVSLFATTLAQRGLTAAMLANPVGLIIAGIAALVAIGIVLYRNWDTIKVKALELWASLSEKFTAIKAVIIEKISQAISGALTFFAALPGKVAYWLGYMVAKTVSFLSTLPDTFKKWFSGASDGATDIVSELPGKIADFLAEIPGKAAGIISDVIAKFKELGSAIPNAIADGFNAAKDLIGGAGKWALDKIIGGVTNFKSLGKSVVSGFASGFGAGGGAAQVDGSHYNGLANVPFNGYVAKLHKGERVMTAAENKSYSGGKGSNVVNLTVHYNGGQKLDEQEMSRFTNYLVKNLASAGAAGA